MHDISKANFLGDFRLYIFKIYQLSSLKAGQNCASQVKKNCALHAELMLISKLLLYAGTAPEIIVTDAKCGHFRAY